MADQIAGFSTGAFDDLPTERVPKIPNTMYDAPPVSIFQCKSVSYMEDPDGYEAWYEYRDSGIRAEIREYNDREKAIAAKCGRKIEEGTFTRETSFSKVPAGAVILRRVRNPWLPIPTGCKLAEDELTLVKA